MTALSLLFISNTHADMGSAGADFLMLGSGAAPSAVGGSPAAVSYGINSLMWNPAGITKISHREFSATHSEWLEGVRYEFFGCAQKVKNTGTFALSVFYLHMSAIEKRLLNGTEDGSFSASDMSASISFGREISANLSLGTNLKLINQNIDKENAFGVALDIGGMYNIKDTSFKLGGALLNIGPSMKFIKTRYPLPLALNIGGAYSYGTYEISLNLLHRILEKESSASFGIEYKPIAYLSLRGGYLLTLAGSAITNNSIGENGISNLNAGLGFKVKDHQIDYTFTPFAQLGNTHRISLTGRF